jgi:hypothetical protein
MRVTKSDSVLVERHIQRQRFRMVEVDTSITDADAGSAAMLTVSGCRKSAYRDGRELTKHLTEPLQR